MSDLSTARIASNRRLSAGLVKAVLLAAGLSAVLFGASGCAKGGKTATFGSGDDLLGYGEYVAQTMDPTGHMIKIKLNQNNTYVKKKFLGPCLLVESMGEWKSTNEVMEFRLQEIRRRDDCNTEAWQTEKPNKVSEKDIRNITPKSFELLDQEEQSNAEWVKFVKP